MFPSFGVEYAVEISQVEAKIAYRLALREWRGGDTAGARRILRPHLSVRPALLAPYLFTFLSYRLFHELMRRRLRAA